MLGDFYVLAFAFERRVSWWRVKTVVELTENRHGATHALCYVRIPKLSCWVRIRPASPGLVKSFDIISGDIEWLAALLQYFTLPPTEELLCGVSFMSPRELARIAQANGRSTKFECAFSGKRAEAVGRSAPGEAPVLHVAAPEQGNVVYVPAWNNKRAQR